MTLRNIRFIILTCLIGCLSQGFAASLSDYEVGKHYARFPLNAVEQPAVEALTTALKPGEIHVLEFFSYGCIWCYRLDAAVEAWLPEKPDYIKFERIPVIFQPSWKMLTQAYYAAQSLEVLDKVHTPLFASLHDNGVVVTPEYVTKLFTEQAGVTPEDFEVAMGAFTVENRVKTAEKLAQVFKVRRIPSVAILTPNAGYFATVAMAGGETAFFELIEAFAAAEQAKLAEQSDAAD